MEGMTRISKLSRMPGPQNNTSRFERIIAVGSGTYALQVLKAYDTVHQCEVALKILKVDSERDKQHALEEIEILRKLRAHPHVVTLLDDFLLDDGSEFCLVFEYMEHDLLGLIAQPDIRFSVADLKVLLHHLLRGMVATTDFSVMHRDIKAANLLINKQGILKIADYGSATCFTARNRFHSEVCTLFYRAPELLLGATSYGPKIDVWSAAVVALEVLWKRNRLRGMNEDDQLRLICELIGCSRSEKLQGLPKHGKLAPYANLRPTLEQVVQPYLGDDGYDLLGHMLEMDPDARWSARRCLEHPFFEGVAGSVNLSHVHAEYHSSPRASPPQVQPQVMDRVRPSRPAFSLVHERRDLDGHRTMLPLKRPAQSSYEDDLMAFFDAAPSAALQKRPAPDQGPEKCPRRSDAVVESRQVVSTPSDSPTVDSSSTAESPERSPAAYVNPYLQPARRKSEMQH